jgi:hypothetical protein
MRYRQRTLAVFGRGLRNAKTQRARALGPVHARSVTALVAALSLLPLLPPASAAPPPPPGAESSQATLKARDYIRQAKSFDAAGLPVPAPPGNGGQCLIELGGQVQPLPGQRGQTSAYRLYEIQRWVVSPVPSQAGQNPLLYLTTWTTSGNGTRHEDNGYGEVNDWTWTVAGTNTVPLQAKRIAAGTWLAQVPQASAANGITVTQQHNSDVPMTYQQTAFAYGYPAMVPAPPLPGSAPGTAWRISEAKTWLVPSQVNWGYPRPGYAKGTIGCSWNLAVGP